MLRRGGGNLSSLILSKLYLAMFYYQQVGPSFLTTLIDLGPLNLVFKTYIVILFWFKFVKFWPLLPPLPQGYPHCSTDQRLFGYTSHGCERKELNEIIIKNNTTKLLTNSSIFHSCLLHKEKNPNIFLKINLSILKKKHHHSKENLNSVKLSRKKTF